MKKRSDSISSDYFYSSLIKATAVFTATVSSYGLLSFFYSLGNGVSGVKAVSKIGSESQVNTFTTGDQLDPDVASLVNGSFVIVWQSWLQDGSGYGVYGQLFDMSAGKIGVEFLVNTYTNNSQQNPRVKAFSTGNFIVVWESDLQDGSGLGVYGQLYSPLAVEIGTEFGLSNYTIGDQAEPNVAILPNDDFIAAWCGEGLLGAVGISGQQFNFSGATIGSQFQIGTPSSNTFSALDLISFSNGNYVAVWEESAIHCVLGKCGHSLTVLSQLLDLTSQPIGSEIPILNTVQGSGTATAIGALQTMGYIVVWDLNSFVYCQHFNYSENSIGQSFVVDSSFQTSQQADPCVSFLSKDKYIVLWDGTGPLDPDTGVYGQLFDASDSQLAPGFLVNTITIGTQSNPRVAYLTTGNFVVAYNSLDTSGIGVFLQMFYGQDALVINNPNQTVIYVENTAKSPFTAISISSLYPVTAVFSLSDPSAGVLSTSNLGLIVPSYNQATGVWQGSGDVNDLNSIIAGMSFIPANLYQKNFTVFVEVTDIFNAVANGLIHVITLPIIFPGNSTTNGSVTVVTEVAIDTTPAIVGGAVGGALLLGGAVGVGFWYRKRAQDATTRKQHRFADHVRDALKLNGVDNFDSENGQYFIAVTQKLENEFSTQGGMSLIEMSDDELNVLAKQIAKSARNKITSSTTLFGYSIIKTDDFNDRKISEIVQDVLRMRVGQSDTYVSMSSL